MQPRQPIPIDRIIETVEKEDGWLVVEDLHLGTDEFFRELVYHLVRTFKSREAVEEEKRDGKFCVWLTSEVEQELPERLTRHLLTVAWDQVSDQLLSSANSEPDTIQYNTLSSALGTVIVNILSSVPDDALDASANPTYTFGLVVVHSALVCRQLLGTRGVSQRAGLSLHYLYRAVDLVQGLLDQGELALDDVCEEITRTVYGAVLSRECDRRYVRALVRQVMSAVHKSESSIVLGSVQIPVPRGADLQSMAESFEQSMADQPVSTLDAMCLSDDVEREWNRSRALIFMQTLDRSVRTNKMDCGEVASDVFAHINLYTLRLALDFCWDNLPPMLDFSQSDNGLSGEPPTFPYHCPSVVSFSTASSSLMPESLAFVLLQECLWLNSVLQHVRQTVHVLRRCLLRGAESIPRALLPVAMALQRELVPLAWLHVNRRPSVHTLLSWLDDTRKAHEQMSGWIRYGQVSTDGDSPRGQLHSVWLGGMVNPQALFMALRHEKAIMSNCLVTEVSLQCECEDGSGEGRHTPDYEDVGVVLNELYVQGAVWDTDNKRLKLDSADLSPLPSMRVRAVRQDPSEDAPAESGFTCSIFMNKSRQVEAGELTIPSGVEESSLLASGTALLVDPGVLDGSRRHTRLVRQAQQTGQFLLSPRAVDFNGYLDTDRTQESSPPTTHRTQLSYKEFTPKTSPLPPTLRLERGEEKLEAESESESARSKSTIQEESPEEVAAAEKTSEKPESEPEPEPESEPGRSTPAAEPEQEPTEADDQQVQSSL